MKNLLISLGAASTILLAACHRQAQKADTIPGVYAFNYCDDRGYLADTIIVQPVSGASYLFNRNYTFRDFRHAPLKGHQKQQSFVSFYNSPTTPMLDTTNFHRFTISPWGDLFTNGLVYRRIN